MAAAWWCIDSQQAGSFYLQDVNPLDLLPGVLPVLHRNIGRLSTALQWPGMVAASAAVDPDAVAVLCILAMAGPTSIEEQPTFPLLDLQPAAADCLRCVHSHHASPCTTESVLVLTLHYILCSDEFWRLSHRCCA